MKTPPPTPPDAFPDGAEWVRADFHLHTDADQEFKYSGDPDYYMSAYVDALEKAGTRLGVITNHNKFNLDEFNGLRSAAGKKGIGLLPGVELSINEGRNGVHVLILFSDAWLDGSNDYITASIGSMFPGKTPEQYQHENGKSDRNLLQVVETLDGLDKDYVLIFAHVEDPKGLWEEVGCGRLGDWKEDRFSAIQRRTLGFQKVRSYNKESEAGKPCRTKVQRALGEWYPAEVEGSDPKSIERIGKGKPCFLKLGELSFGAVKFALGDPASRVAKELPQRTVSHIRSLHFEGGILNGKTIRFSPELNTLIGIRGSGKSSILEAIRYPAIDFTDDRDGNFFKVIVSRQTTNDS